MIIQNFSTIEEKLIDFLKSEGYVVGKFEIDVNVQRKMSKVRFIQTEKVGDTEITKVQRLN